MIKKIIANWRQRKLVKNKTALTGVVTPPPILVDWQTLKAMPEVVEVSCGCNKQCACGKKPAAKKPAAKKPAAKKPAAAAKKPGKK